MTLAQLNDATSYVLGASSGNSNAVVELYLTPSDADLATVVVKVDELIPALLRWVGADSWGNIGRQS